MGARAGWYKDPAGTPGRIRYFDGRAWTGRIRDLAASASAASTAPVGAPGAAVTPTGGDPGEGLMASRHTNDSDALLAAEFANWTPPERPTSAEAGWYHDPGRSRKLRFYDGNGWTARIRVPLEQQMRHLPKAAVTARAKLLAAADARAAQSDAGEQWRTYRHTVQRPQSLYQPARSKSGRVGSMLSVAAIVAALSMSGFAGYQQYAAPAMQRHAQGQLRTDLAHEFASQGGDYDNAFTASSAPAPSQIEGHDPVRTQRPELGAHPADLAPFPPTGWSAPAHRQIRNLDGYQLGDPVGRLIIPRMHLDEVMVAGIGMNELAKGPGVARYAMMPGSPGNAVIAGHRTGWGEPFRHLDELRYGDQIIVEIPGQERSVYEVRSRVIVLPTNTRVAEQTEGVRLTLTSCHPVSVNTHRMVVEAEMVQGPWLDRAVNRSQFRTVQ